MGVVRYKGFQETTGCVLHADPTPTDAIWHSVGYKWLPTDPGVVMTNLKVVRVHKATEGIYLTESK